VTIHNKVIHIEETLREEITRLQWHWRKPAWLVNF
jgi:hypothetical protein